MSVPPLIRCFGVRSPHAKVIQGASLKSLGKSKVKWHWSPPRSRMAFHGSVPASKNIYIYTVYIYIYIYSARIYIELLRGTLWMVPISFFDTLLGPYYLRYVDWKRLTQHHKHSKTPLGVLFKRTGLIRTLISLGFITWDDWRPQHKDHPCVTPICRWYLS